MQASQVPRAMAAGMSAASSLDLTADDAIVLHDSNRPVGKSDYFRPDSFRSHGIRKEKAVKRQRTLNGLPLTAITRITTPIRNARKLCRLVRAVRAYHSVLWPPF
jgi:hypothetical protein